MILIHIKLQYFLKWNWKKFEYARNWTRRLSEILAFKFPSASTLGCFDVTWSRYWLLPRIKLASLKTIRGLGRVSFLQRLLGSFPGTRYSAIGQFACHLPSNSPGSPCESQLGTVSLFLKAQFQSCFYWLLRKKNRLFPRMWRLFVITVDISESCYDVWNTIATFPPFQREVVTLWFSFSLGLESFRFLLGFEGLVASALLSIVLAAWTELTYLLNHFWMRF